MMQFPQRVFFRLYPSQQKETDTLEGDHLRTTVGVLCILHSVFFLVSLTVIGFYSMLMEVAYAVWLYSCYLTLKEWQVVLYIIALFFGFAHGIFNLFQFSDMRLLFYIINLVYYGCALFFIIKNYKDFRVTGGIHGAEGTQKVKAPKEVSSTKGGEKSSEKKKGKKTIDSKKEGLVVPLLEEGQKPQHLDNDNEKGPGRA
ncbi:UNKNOWN [Stylonychia lemnae]|uniref:Uncharacterized protein n=1 Tax=Stylonychia lemnae TaxID=5949 RepID=A0A078B2R9_STYLE|nr:UNKNOWN [Stylonychia lemnae]|eukprot:CDW88769.1 UNKNOWN [Stylonychia lemnae]